MRTPISDKACLMYGNSKGIVAVETIRKVEREMIGWRRKAKAYEMIIRKAHKANTRWCGKSVAEILEEADSWKDGGK